MKNNDSLLVKALSLLNQNKYSLAKLVCQKIISQQASSYQAHLLLGVIALHEEELDSALLALNTALELAHTPHDQAQALNNLGLAYTHLKLYDSALDKLNQAINTKPNQPLFYCNRANVFERLERWKEMRLDLERALTLDNSISDAYISLAIALRKLGQITTSLATLEKQAQPIQQDWIQEWVLLLALTEQQPAIDNWLNDNKENPDCLIATAGYILEQGYAQLAIQLYERLTSLYPNNLGLLHQLHSLKGVRTDQPPSEYVTELFDACAGEFEQRLVEILDYQVPTLIAKVTQSYIQQTVDKVIDLGCGTGLVGRALREVLSIEHLIGVDLSAEMLLQSESNGGYQTLHQGDIVTYLSTQHAVDLITAADVLIYVGDVTPLLAAANHALTDNGFFIFSTENCQHDWCLTKSGRYQHSVSHIANALTQSGLKLAAHQACNIRMENNQPVKGTIFVACKG